MKNDNLISGNVKRPVCFINKKNELMIHGRIGDWDDGLDAKTVIASLDSMPGDSITVRIHSEGGYVAEGLAIYNKLKNSPKKVYVEIEGLAASMASVIAMAGDHISMPENALMMIHNVWVQSKGDANHLRKEADACEAMGKVLLNIYHQRTKIPKDTLQKMLNEETFMDGKKALNLGFVDKLVGDTKISATLDSSKEVQKIFNQLNKGENIMSKQLEEELENFNDQDEDHEASLPRVSASHERKLRKCLAAFGEDHELADRYMGKWLREGTSIETARAEAFNTLVEKSRTQMPGSAHNREAFDWGLGRNGSSAVFSEALASRHTGIEVSDQAANFSQMSVVDIAARMLEEGGLSVRGKSASKIIHMAMHTTSDFPELLTETGNRILLHAYSAVPSALKVLSKKTTARDFRPMTRVQLTGNANLDVVNQAGEFKHGTMFSASESYGIKTFGQLFSISRQALINDDLGAFNDSATIMGRMAADFESQRLVDLLVSNPDMSDGNAIFSSEHSNIAASGAALDVTTLGAARMAMRLQKSINGVSPISIAPRYLVVPAALETAAEQLMTEIYAATVDNANPFTKKLEILVEPRLDAVSATGWYLFADPALAPVLEYAYLSDNEGPYFESRNGFERDAMEIKLRLDFGAGLVDHRGSYYNAGA